MDKVALHKNAGMSIISVKNLEISSIYIKSIFLCYSLTNNYKAEFMALIICLSHNTAKQIVENKGK